MTTSPGKCVLLTGGSGFIGRHAIGRLVERGYEVHAVARSPQPGVPGAAATWHVGDLLEDAFQQSLIAAVRPTHLLHLAWFTAHGKYWTAPENLDWVLASVSLVRHFVLSGGRRLVCAGTCAEYDWTCESCFAETAATRPATLYGVCKNGVREIVERYASNQGVSNAWGRLFFLYGPGETAARLVPALVEPLLRGERAECRFGDHVRDFMHAADAAAALADLLDSEVAGAVNIASGRPCSLGLLARTIARKLARPALLHVEARAPTADNPARLTADIQRLSGEVGWRPRFDLDSGLDDVLETYHARAERVLC
jgi:nucleoside-diphosphate-sugar epimerase